MSPRAFCRRVTSLGTVCVPVPYCICQSSSGSGGITLWDWPAHSITPSTSKSPSGPSPPPFTYLSLSLCVGSPPCALVFVSPFQSSFSSSTLTLIVSAHLLRYVLTKPPSPFLNLVRSGGSGSSTSVPSLFNVNLYSVLSRSKSASVPSVPWCFMLFFCVYQASH